MLSTLQEKNSEFIWSQRELKAIFQSASGHSGGLISCWNLEVYELCNFESMHHCLGITLKIIHTGIYINVFNIYGPYQNSRKKDLWKKLKDLHTITQANPLSIFIGDFNCVRSSRERVACSNLGLDHVQFNH